MMLESDRLVKEAYTAIRKGRPSEAAVILEKLPKNGYDPYPLFLDALASMMCDRIDNGLASCRRLRAHYPDYIPGRELDAFVRIKSAKTKDEAVVSIIELIPQGSDARHFRKLAEKTRHARDFDRYQRMLSVKDCVRYSKHTPARKYEEERQSRSVHGDSHKKKRGIRYILIFVMIILLSAGTVIGYFHFISGNVGAHDDNNDIYSRTILPDERYPLIGKKSIDEKYLYGNEDALRTDYDTARRLMKSSKYNDALIILNRILHSNAQPGIKDRAQFLVKYISGVSDRNAEPIPCGRISSDPVIFRGAMISVTGKVRDVSSGTGMTSLTMVPDSDVKRIVEVFSKTAVKCGSGDRIIVEGLFSQIVGKDSRLYVEARSVLKE